MSLTNKEMYVIDGGVNISGTLLNAIAKLINTIFDVGRSIGTAINMSRNGRKC